jgi:hypothetical protein
MEEESTVRKQTVERRTLITNQEGQLEEIEKVMVYHNFFRFGSRVLEAMGLRLALFRTSEVFRRESCIVKKARRWIHISHHISGT